MTFFYEMQMYQDGDYPVADKNMRSGDATGKCIS